MIGLPAARFAVGMGRELAAAHAYEIENRDLVAPFQEFQRGTSAGL